MAKAAKKKKKKKKPVVSNVVTIGKSGMIKSAFIEKLDEKFPAEQAGETYWPPEFADPEDASFSATIRDDLGDAFRFLFQKLEVTEVAHQVPIPSESLEGSVTKRLSELVAATGWPKNFAALPVANLWRGTSGQLFRRYEIVCAMNIFMRDYNLLNPGGSVTWPPQKPGKS